MELSLQSPLHALQGVGETRAAAFARLGLHSVRDLLLFFPRAYENRGDVRAVAETQDGQLCSLLLQIDAKAPEGRTRTGLTVTKLAASDNTGAINLTFFNQPWLTKSLRQGLHYRFYGRVVFGMYGREMTNPVTEPLLPGGRLPDVVPVYPLTRGLTGKAVADTVRRALPLAEALPELIPEPLRAEYRLLPFAEAVRGLHFPASMEALEQARRTVAFSEMLVFQLAMRELRAGSRAKPAYPMQLKGAGSAAFFRALPFRLTGAQERAIREIFSDMTSGQAMMRLVQGDVGSGKTMVAAAACFCAVRNGRQAAFMAPTEILARQHYQGLAPLLARFSIRCALLTGSTRAKERREILAGLADGSIDLCIGTHALLTEDVQYQKLGLVVTDEQHRFGVNQRAALSQKAEDPHMLVLSATPIPRTLALVIYGDLDVSVIDELPPGRQKVDTFALGESYRPRVQAFIRKLAAAGQQIFIVCPLVGEADQIPDERKAVTAYAKQLQEQVFPDLRVAVLHGKMKPKEKEKVMAAFAAGESDILVSTTVVEVGVDVPNATCMVVENADRFGLSQLHQLRGRVGRGKAKSYCILLSDSQNEETRARLKVMTQTNDGFRISQEDLRLRGPGDFFGQRQHGLPAMKIADLSCDMRLLDEAQTAARQLMERDPELTDPAHRPLRRRIRQLFDTNADMLN